MKHSFRKSLIHKEEHISLTETTIQLRTSRGKLKREIEFQQIAEFHECSGMSAVDKNHKSFEILIARIVPKRGQAITIQSSSYIGAAGRGQMAKDNSKTFHRLISALKSRTVDCNPDVALVTGNRIASILGYIVALICLVVFLLTISSPIVLLFSNTKSLGEIWPVLLVSLIVTTVFGVQGLVMAISYTPQTECRSGGSEVVCRRVGESVRAEGGVGLLKGLFRNSIE